MVPSIYINLEDSVEAIAARIKRERSSQVIVVCPKRCFLFSDPINLKLLKTQADALGKEVFILTMDEKGRQYAQAAGLGLRDLPRPQRAANISDIRLHHPTETQRPVTQNAAPPQDVLAAATSTLDNLTQILQKKQTDKQQSKAAAAEPPRINSAPQVFAKPEGAEEAAEMSHVAVKDSIFPKEFEDRIKHQKKIKSGRRLVWFLVAGGLALCLILVFLILPKAVLEVYRKTEPITRDMDVSLSSVINQYDADRLVMPAVKVQQALEISDKFESQGKQQVGNKATGSVIIYNFTKVPINLKSATTVLTLNGKNYNLAADAMQIRPTLYKNAKTKEVDPASLSAPVDVVAVEGGESYNVPAGTRLEITNQVFGSKPQLLYAKTSDAIDGGISRFLSVVTAQDIASAEESLKADLISQLRQDLAAKKLVLPDNGYQIQIVSYTPDKPAGSQSPSFQADLKASVQGLAFSGEDLQRLMTARLQQNISAGHELGPNQNQPSSYSYKTVDLNAGTAVLSAHFDGQIVADVDVSGLAGRLAGKGEGEINNVLSENPGIDHIDVNFVPAWQSWFPFLSSKIKIVVN
ncbi:MAG: hypothetical protein KGJ93_00255 [Patescibacteria group bacterium]|nr:hypothetical protein [Patescibacteria group bacterium]